MRFRVRWIAVVKVGGTVVVGLLALQAAPGLLRGPEAAPLPADVGLPALPEPERDRHLPRLAVGKAVVVEKAPKPPSLPDAKREVAPSVKPAAPSPQSPPSPAPMPVAPPLAPEPAPDPPPAPAAVAPSDGSVEFAPR